jgi:FkbM family methyltransferase
MTKRVREHLREVRAFLSCGCTYSDALRLHFLQRLVARRKNLRKVVKLHFQKGRYHPIYIRLPGSDVEVFKQSLGHRREYEHAASLVQDPKWIVDLGANIGLASVFFLERFPGCKVLAVEPDPENIDICRLNLAPYGDRVTLIQAAVWPHRTRLNVSHDFGDGLAWATKVVQSAPGEAGAVEGIDMPTLIGRTGGAEIDFLKMDIEGAELPLFSADTSWLGRVKALGVELHDHFLPGCWEAFHAAVKPHLAPGTEVERRQHTVYAVLSGQGVRPA